jgi:peptidoglycan/xylan/chitin deacetylase (PgdA/CDA1 family)
MKVALTFDDGPDPRWTPRLLDLLGELGAPATFFVIASRARRHPQLIERMRAEGHEVGLHGALHLDHTCWPADLIEADTLTALDWLGEPRPRLWRLPWGAFAPVSAHLATKHGLRLVHWTVDSEDWSGLAAGAMLERLRPALVPDAIVLMHDAVGPSRRGHGGPSATREPTLELVAPLLGEIRERGLEPALLD